MLIPGDAGAEASGSGTAPLLQPVEDIFELLLSLWVVGLKSIRHNVLLNSVFPRLFAVFEQPLVAEGDNARLARTCNDFLFRFVVRNGHTVVDHLFSNNWFCKFNLLSGRYSNLHHSFVETFLIAFVFCFFKSVDFLVRFDLGFLDGELGAQIAHPWHVYERDRVEALDPL